MRLWLRRVWYLLRRRRFETDLAEELDFRHAMKQRELEDAGVPPNQSLIAARRALGSVALTHNHARDVWVPRWFQVGTTGGQTGRTCRSPQQRVFSSG